ncbi:MAG: tetratricopeptide repeat protein [Candidatus Latescibacteria bacterium]|nr:tetratricopeptide repeat protein [Candidatus Latescibacterota bacterium]
MADKTDLYIEGVTHYGAGRIDEAITCYKETITLDPSFADAYIGLAMAYEKKRMLDEAVEAAKQGIVLAPDDPLNHTTLSRLYQQKGMIPEAEEEQAKARQLSGY